jgi:hypothetical protein
VCLILLSPFEARQKDLYGDNTLDFGKGLLKESFDAHLKREGGARTARTRPAETDFHDSLVNLDKLDIATVGLKQRLDFRVNDLFDLFFHARFPFLSVLVSTGRSLHFTALACPISTVFGGNLFRRDENSPERTQRAQIKENV